MCVCKASSRVDGWTESGTDRREYSNGARDEVFLQSRPVSYGYVDRKRIPRGGEEHEPALISISHVIVFTARSFHVTKIRVSNEPCPRLRGRALHPRLMQGNATGEPRRIPRERFGAVAVT